MNLRKLIKYEERLGVNTQQNDYYESLFRRTTASYRAKIDKENTNGTKRKSLDSEKPTTSKQAATERRKVLGERNYGGTSTSSYDILDSSQAMTKKEISAKRSKQGQGTNENNTERNKIDTRSVKALIEDSITKILHEKYSQEFMANRNDRAKSPKDKTPIKSVVEEVVKEKLSQLRYNTKEKSRTEEPNSLRSVIEDIVKQVLKEKLACLQISKDKDETMKNLSQDLQQKLNVSKDSSKKLTREPLNHYNANKSLDSQALVQELLAVKDVTDKQEQNKISKKSTKTDKENSCAGGIKRLPRSQKKPEWQDPRPNDIILDKPKRNVRSHSPAASSTARSGRSKGSSSVLIRRSVSQGRHNKPNSDPVALYQYYKNEWDHFRQQIPGETSHSRLRWHVRQRLLDPE